MEGGGEEKEEGAGEGGTAPRRRSEGGEGDEAEYAGEGGEERWPWKLRMGEGDPEWMDEVLVGGSPISPLSRPDDME